MKKSKKMFAFITLLILAIVVTPNFVKATHHSGFDDVTITDDSGGSSDTSTSPFNNPGVYNPNIGGIDGSTDEDVDTITSKVNKIIGAITTVGVAISVITTIILGIKYMVGSIEEKAEYKKTMIPYIIGVIFLLSTSIIVGLIAKLVDATSLTAF